MRIPLDGIIVGVIWLLYLPLVLIYSSEPIANLFLGVVGTWGYFTLNYLTTLIRRKIRQRKYNSLIKKKMSILAKLQEECRETEALSQKYTALNPSSEELPQQARLPADFFEKAYMEVK